VYILGTRRKGKTPLGKTKQSWEHDIKTYLSEITYESLNWIYLAHKQGLL
jgi:hypothetical protein